MTDQELGMMYQKAAHFTRIYIYKWVLTDPSPNNDHLKNLWRVGQVAVHRGQTRASVLSTRKRNYMYPRNTDVALPGRQNGRQGLQNLCRHP